MKIQARRRRKQREAQRSQLHAEKKRRMKALINQYEEWSEGLLTGGHIDLALVREGEGWEERDVEESDVEKRR